MAKAKRIKAEAETMNTNLLKVQEVVAEMYKTLETTCRTYETDVKIFFAKISAKVKERESEVISGLQKQINGVQEYLDGQKKGIEDQGKAISNLLAKIDNLSNTSSPYKILSKEELTRRYSREKQVNNAEYDYNQKARSQFAKACFEPGV